MWVKALGQTILQDSVVRETALSVIQKAKGQRHRLAPSSFEVIGGRGFAHSAQEYCIVTVIVIIALFIVYYMALTPSAGTYTASGINRSTVPHYSLRA